MQEEKSFVYTLILGACMLISLLLIGKMLLGHPSGEATPPTQTEPQEMQEEQDEIMEVQLSENDLCTLIVQAMPFSPDSIVAHIGKDGVIEVSVIVSKQALQQSGLAGDLRTALLFLPNSCKVYGAWKVEAADGSISLKTQKAEIADISLSETAVAPLSELLNKAVNDQLQNWGITVSSIECDDGVVVLKP